MLTNPLALIAEVTHRCPLHCVYCSNPVQLAADSSELSTADWLRVFSEASQLGVLHAHFTGGEPLARKDVADLIGGARRVGLYTNLITSGIGITRERMQQLVASGLDHIQLSFQDSREEAAAEISGVQAHTRKIDVARWIREHALAFTVNIVVHGQNLDHLEEIISFAEQLRPDRMEIAHAQYYGWALKNRAALMPTRTQVDRAVEIVAAAQERLKGSIRIDSVVPDYYARYPKACMGGWGRRTLLVNPSGKVLPCHAAEIISNLAFDTVRERSLSWIWRESASFQRFRRDDWMPEPCRSCERRHQDFGGCRCQALLLTGDSTATDPACSLAPEHYLVEQVVQRAQVPADVSVGELQANGWTYRKNSAPDVVSLKRYTGELQ
jgi:PqqA peptide cyclase